MSLSRPPVRARLVLAVLALIAALAVPVARLSEPPRRVPAALEPAPAASAVPEPAPPVAARPPAEFEIRPGESLPRTLARAGLDTPDRVAIGQALRGVADPRRIKPGERVTVEWTPAGRPA